MSLIKHFSRFVAAVTAASLVIAPVAQADRDRGDRGGWERHDDDDYHEYRRDHRRDDRRDYRRDRRDHDYYDYRRHKPVVVYRPAYDYYPRSSVTVTYGSSYGPYYYSGYRPRYDVGHYYSYGPRRTVYIHDYDHYGLYDPPRGYHWVRDNDSGDAILASVATGAILGLVIGAIAAD
ncbi:RcnB family protein [Hyphomonas sp.]|jgi:Ni/Co efflux regulator RcnB|uniref:RcnB family protein n=1 Tax=Hyphomonas sp. TaxID=87 RepID=UPI0025B968F3|nr:RcnB family protein [Hyphomonas sp.]